MTPTELELTNRWLKLYEAKDVLYEEKIRIENEYIKLKADYQSLQVAFEQKSSFLVKVLKDKRDVYRQVGALEEEKRWLNARLEKCRQLFADNANKNNPKWPPLDKKEIPPFRMTHEEERIIMMNDDILDLFKQSLNRI